MPKAILLSMHDLDLWSSKAVAHPAPGGSLPYGIQHLRRHYGLSWSDAQHHGVWQSELSRKAGSFLRRQAPGFQGVLTALYATRRLEDADVALSIFENAGLAFSRLQRLPAYSSMPHIMMTCWLAEDCRHFSACQLRSVRRSAASVDRFIVFSSNQIPILSERLNVAPARISVVPFGVDVNYYDPSSVGGSNVGGGVVAIGMDRSRDYSTLINASRIANIPLTLVTYPKNLAGLSLPSKVKILSGIKSSEYRKILMSADLVVTPTTAPAYPGGQSVVLEAMAMGKATLTTDSPAMREYVTDGVDGVLMPPHEPHTTARLINEILSDSSRAKSLGTRAAQTVRENFSLENLWSEVSEIMSDVCKSS